MSAFTIDWANSPLQMLEKEIREDAIRTLLAGGPGSGRHKGIHADLKEYTKFKSNVPAGKAHECQTNSARVNRQLGHKTVVGIIVERKSRGMFQGKKLELARIPHAWNVDKEGNALDTTLGDRGPKEYKYYGKEMPDAIGKNSVKIDDEFYTKPIRSSLTLPMNRTVIQRNIKIKAGGPGSGRHKTFYHGTTSDKLRSILKNGLHKDGATRLDESFAEHNTFAVPLSLQKKVSLAQYRNTAAWYAKSKAIYARLPYSKTGNVQTAILPLKPDEYGPEGASGRKIFKTKEDGPVIKDAKAIVLRVRAPSDSPKDPDESYAHFTDHVHPKQITGIYEHNGKKWVDVTLKHIKAMSAGGPGSGRHKIKFLSVTKSGKSQYVGSHQYVINYIHNGENKYAYHTAESVKHAKELLIDHLRQQGKLEAGGPGSGRHPSGLTKEQKTEQRRLKQMEERRALNKQGLSQRGKPIVSDKAKLALKHMNVATKAMQDKAEAIEHNVHQALKGSLKSKDNAPFDIVHKGHGIEVKAILYQKNDKITQKGEAISKKAAYAKANKLKGMHTVAVDYRGKTPVVYHRVGVGSFRLGSMTKVKNGFAGLSNYIK